MFNCNSCGNQDDFAYFYGVIYLVDGNSIDVEGDVGYIDKHHYEIDTLLEDWNIDNEYVEDFKGDIYCLDCGSIDI